MMAGLNECRTCNFSKSSLPDFPHLECSSELFTIDTFNTEDKSIFLTSCGISPGTGFLLFKNICSSHVHEFRNAYKKRCMKRLCSVPSVVCYHSGQNCKTERYISSPQVKTIFNNTGIVLPVGTGLCTKCRKSLLKQAQCEELSLDVSKIMQGDQQPYMRQETHISDHEMTDNVPEFRSRTTVDSYSQPDNVHIEADEEHTCMFITNRRKRKAKECLDDLVLSQETDQSLAGGSQVSEASVCVIEKLDKLNEFLSLSGISPVKKIQGPLESASTRTIQRYKLKARQCLNSVFETICPGEAPFLEAELYPESLKDNTMKTLLEIYTKADTWMFRRQVLSILTEQLNYDALRKMIPNITQWRYYEAKRHTDKSGAGQPVQPSKQQREKFDAKCLEHFIDFITSNQIIKDLPFGDKTLRLSTGEIRNIPNVVRSIAPVSIIKQYNQLCEEDQVKPLGTSTLYKLLDECAASVRKSMEGLDNYITEGGRAFVELEKLVALLPEDTQALKARLQEAKQYLKTDMKIHVRQTSTVADHCAPYALSTSDPCFKEVCDHEHHSRCDSCSDMADLFDMLLTKVIANTWENRDSVLYTVEKAIDDIKEWKKHLVRARNQEEARRNLTDKMNENEALITFDWAMKFLPRKYREGQVDWYAKRGINWHISVSLMKKGVTFDSITHVHIFENPTSQDADVTSQIMVNVVTDLVKVLPTLNKFHLFSDNAGCYKSSTTLTQLHSGLGNLLDTYNFSEAQNGKGPCDRKASHIKSSIKRYVNEGNDVITAQQMKQAIDQNQQGKYKVKVVNAVTNLDSGANIIKSNIPEITSLHNFKFTEDALVVWKAYNIGEGKTIPWTQLKSDSNKELSVVLDWRDVALTRFQEDENESTDMNTQIKKRAIFMCPVEGCVREFSTNSNLDNHLLLGNCDYKLEKQCLTDLAITIYSKKINDGFPSSTSGQHGQRSECGNNISTEGDYINPMGWALKGKRKKTVFSTAQKQYMKEQFEIGKRTGKKVDPFYAAEEMRKLSQFDKKTFLSGQQIASYFSRLAQLDRKADLGDIIAAEEEDQKTLLKKEIMDKLNK